MRKRLAILTAALLVPAAPASGAIPPSSAAAVQKSCGAGYTHASLSWGHKCLRRGQFCKLSGDREYHRYRVHCHTGRLK